MSNPYQSPQNDSATTSPEDFNPPTDPRRAVRTPAICMIVVSSTSSLLFLISICSNIFLLYNGFEYLDIPEELREEVNTQLQSKAGLKATFGAVVLAMHLTILFSAINMLNFRNYRFCMIGSCLALLPCCGPCYLLGIPFGIWNLKVLDRKDVKALFEETERTLDEKFENEDESEDFKTPDR